MGYDTNAPRGIPGVPAESMADDDSGRSVAGAAQDASALTDFGEEDAPGEQGISSSGDTLAEDTKEDAERADTGTDDDRTVPPVKRT